MNPFLIETINRDKINHDHQVAEYERLVAEAELAFPRFRPDLRLVVADGLISLGERIKASAHVPNSSVTVRGGRTA